MEALRSDTLHPSETVHSLSCITTNHMDELSKEKEEELLYGTGDDGDEEDALSDDSIRLRLSDDDDIEAEDLLTPVLDTQENKRKNNDIELTPGKDEDIQASPVPENKITKSNTPSMEVNQEEHCSGNVSMDDNIVFNHEKGVKRNENRPAREQTSTMIRPWPAYESQWRFSRNPGVRSFRNVNHPSYNRCRYLTPRGHFRHQLYEYNMRFHNAFLPFERGRGTGMFNSYNRSMYGNRHPRKAFKSSTVQRLNRSTEFDQNLASPSYTNISPKYDVNNCINNAKVSKDNSVGKNNVLNGEIFVNNDGNSEESKKMLNEKVAGIAIENVQEETFGDTDPDNHVLKSQHNIEERTDIIVSNDTQFKDHSIVGTNISNDKSNEESVNSAINSPDYKQAEETGKRDVNNAILDSSDFCISDNSNTMETSNVGVECDKDEGTKEIGSNSTGNEKEAEADKTTDIDMTDGDGDKATYKVEDEESQSGEVNYETQLAENNCNTLVLDALKEDVTKESDESTVNGDVIDHKVEQILESKEKKVLLQSMKLNESHEGGALKDICITSNNLSNKEDENEIKIGQGDTLIKPVINSENGDNKQLNSSDNGTSSPKISKLIVPEDQLTPKIDLQEQNKDTIQKRTNLAEKENSVICTVNKVAKQGESIALTLNENISSNVKPQLGSLTDSKDNNGGNIKRTIEVPVATQRRRRRTKKMIAAALEAAAEEDMQVRESGRQKRRTAKKAEKIIRQELLLYDSDLEFSDSSEKLVAVNYKMNQDARPLSPPSLKRNCPDTDTAIMNGAVKKVKTNSETPANDIKPKENNSENVRNLNYIHKFFQRDLNEKLPKLKQEELEELLIQKIVETITMRDEIGRLREQARVSEKNQEITRAKCQQLAKQIKDFEMVLSRNAADRRANNDKPTPPIKINRSVGLQVNFITDHGMQNLRQLQQNSSMKPLHISSSGLTPNSSSNETNTNATSPRRGIKIRSPRRTEAISGQTPVISQNPTQSSNIMTTITPAALVVAKPVDAQHSLALSNQSNMPQILSHQQTQQQQPQQAIVLNGKFANQIHRQGSTTVNVAKPRTNDLIDLTDEEEKSKGNSLPAVTSTVTDQQVNLAQKAQPCFQRVIQTIPGNVAITSQPPSIRVVQPASQPTPTALVNNMNAPRLAYVMQSGVGPTRQLLIAPNSSQIRPATSCRPSYPTLTYKTGISTIANGTVRVLTTPATSNIQLNKHPAPLPDTRNYAVNPLWKLPPPAPSLKISKVANGIILSWNMNLSDKYADIASYQLYAYQEIAGVPPNTSLWKKVGDVRALPLPMACTLTQFSEGNNYYFAVRAVDTHSRKGQYSIPGNISL